MSHAPRPVAERFWEKADQSGGVDACWPFRGRPWWGRYATFDFHGADGKWTSTGAHIVAYSLAKGDVPAGICVLHHCDNPPCVNPAHLFLGTRGDNARDMAAKGRVGGAYGRGEKHRGAKLSPQQVLEIRERYATGAISQAALSREYQISDSLVWGIVHYEKWPYLGGPKFGWTTNPMGRAYTR